MKLSRIAGAIALVASLCAVPLASAAPPMELAPGVQLDVPRLPVIHVDVPVLTAATVAAPLAQVDAGTIDAAGDELAPIADALSHAIAADGHVNWFIAAPLIVWGLVYATRKWLAGLLPGKVGDFLRSRIGGVVLTALTSITLAVLSYVTSGGALTTAGVLVMLVKWAYAFLNATAIHEVPKNVIQHLNGDPAGETAMVTLERASGVTGMGPPA